MEHRIGIPTTPTTPVAVAIDNFMTPPPPPPQHPLSPYADGNFTDDDDDDDDDDADPNYNNWVTELGTPLAENMPEPNKVSRQLVFENQEVFNTPTKVGVNYEDDEDEDDEDSNGGSPPLFKRQRFN